jgi:hypothetical protein
LHRPFLKDIGEATPMKRENAGIMTSSQVSDGYLQLRDEDMETLAEFEEEQYRKGHFELLFPVAKTLDDYRGFFGQSRRANQVLWSYVK